MSYIERYSKNETQQLDKKEKEGDSVSLPPTTTVQSDVPLNTVGKTTTHRISPHTSSQVVHRTPLQLPVSHRRIASPYRVTSSLPVKKTASSPIPSASLHETSPLVKRIIAEAHAEAAKQWRERQEREEARLSGVTA